MWTMKGRHWGLSLGALGICASLFFALSKVRADSDQGTMQPSTAGALVKQAGFAPAEQRLVAVSTYRPHGGAPAEAATGGRAQTSTPKLASTEAEARPSAVSVDIIDRARDELRRLKVQQPLSFLSAVLPSDLRLVPRSQKPLVESARAASAQYVSTRVSLLQDMISNYIDSSGSYDFQADLDRLAENDATFRKTVEPLARSIPQLLEFPEVMTNSALPLPEFARASVTLQDTATP